MRDALMTERSGPACIILRRVKKRAACEKPLRTFSQAAPIWRPRRDSNSRPHA